MPYDCGNCGKPIPTFGEWRESLNSPQGYGLPQQHRCDQFVTAETIRRIVREEIRAALGKSV